MFGSIGLSNRSLNEYEPIVGAAALQRLRELAEPFNGLRVLHVTSPGANNAVRTLLDCAVPLMHDLGLDVSWQQVRMPGDVWDMDQDLRRALSGYPVKWTAEREAEWWLFNEGNAEQFDQDYDMVVVHHTGSVGLLPAVTRLRGGRPPGVWAWHSHRDYRAANFQAWAKIREAASGYDAAFYSYREFIRPDAPNKHNMVLAPGVDPLGARARPVAQGVQEVILGQRGISLDKPIIAQIVFSMRDEDPLHVLDAYALVKEARPDVQLVVVNMSPSGEIHEVYEMMSARAQELGDVLILTDLDRVGNVELSTLREVANVLLHQGMPRGVSMELLEEMWQSRPIVSGRSPVALAMLKDGASAIFADTPLEQANAIVQLMDNPQAANRLGRAAHAAVARNLLITHFLERYLKATARLVGKRARKES